MWASSSSRQEEVDHACSLLDVISAQLDCGIELSSFSSTHEYKTIHKSVVLHKLEKEQRPIILVEDVVWLQRADGRDAGCTETRSGRWMGRRWAGSGTSSGGSGLLGGVARGARIVSVHHA